MAETIPDKTSKKSSAINWYVWMIVILILVIIAGMSVNICIMNKQFKKNEAAISNSKQVNNPLKSLKADSTKTIKLKEEDIQKFNDHIDYLSDKVETEVKRTQDNNQYDIDRINVMLAIGIGLLTIIGGLLPLVVNFFSKEHLEKRMEIIEQDAGKAQSASTEAKEKADKAKEDAETAKSEAKKANDSVGGIEEKIKQLGKDLEPMKGEVENVKAATKKVPYIGLLIFQNAVAKLTSTDALRLFIGANRYVEIATYLQNLIAAIDLLHNDLDTAFDIKYFQTVVTELKLALRMGPIRRIPDGRSFQSKIDEIVALLDKFENMEAKDIQAQLKQVSGTISELKKLIEDKAV